MIRLWEKFTVIPGQIEVQDIMVTRRSHGFIAFNVECKQKYVELLSSSGVELILYASELTKEGTYDKEAVPTAVMFPRSVRGWHLTCTTGRYNLQFVLAKPGGGVLAMWERDEEWRFGQFAQAV